MRIISGCECDALTEKLNLKVCESRPKKAQIIEEADIYTQLGGASLVAVCDVCYTEIHEQIFFSRKGERENNSSTVQHET